MARTAPATPSRRSARLASKTPSIAESDAPAAATARVSTRTQTPPAPPPPPPPPAAVGAGVLFRASAVRDEVLAGDRATINKLTKVQLVAVVNSFADKVENQAEEANEMRRQGGELARELASVKAERDQLQTTKTTNAQRGLKMREIMLRQAARDAANPPPSAHTSAPAPATPSAPLAITELPTPKVAPATAPQARGWGKIWNYIPTPFARKRSAKEDTETIESPNKRQRPAASPQTIREQHSTHFSETPTFTFTPADEQQTLEQQTPAPKTARKQKNLFSQSAAKEQTTATLSKTAKTQQTSSGMPQPTIEDEQEPETPSQQTATKQQNVRLQNSNTLQPPPSPATTQKRKRDPTTPLTTISERSEDSEQQATLTQPQTTRTATPARRTIKAVRAAQIARMTPVPRKWAWEKPDPPPRVKNADERLAKIRTAADLRRKLQELENDPDVMRSTKRVKVDNLPTIPHNRPGDSSTTYRVPDIDSEDEMEVDRDVEERSNLFEETPDDTSTPHPAATSAPPPKFALDISQQQQSTPWPDFPQAGASTTRPEQAETSRYVFPQAGVNPEPQHLESPRSLPPSPPQSPPSEQTQLQHTPQPPSEQARDMPRFVFPSVGPIPEDYHVTKEFQQACGALFAAGLAAAT